MTQQLGCLANYLSRLHVKLVFKQTNKNFRKQIIARKDLILFLLLSVGQTGTKHKNTEIETCKTS